MPDVFAARQPIFDRDGRLHGYELLYRSDAAPPRPAGARVRLATDTVLHALIGVGVSRFAGGGVLHVDFPRHFLLDALHDLFEPGTLVVELRDVGRGDELTLAACERLVRAGYRLALEDFVFSEGCEPFLRLAEIVKIDVLGRPTAELAAIAERLRPFQVRLLAARVESGAVRDECARLGFDLFQGYFFARPEPLARRPLAAEQAAVLGMMNLLRDPAATDEEVARAFRADPSLAHRLLALADASAPRGDGVEALLLALHLVGREALARWLALLFVLSLSAPSGTDAELVRMSLLRARLCELIADERGEASGPLFLAGLFSQLDALLQTPMEELLPGLRVTPPVRDALLARRGPYANALDLAELYERGDWRAMAAAAARLGLAAERVAQLYTEALGWTRDRLARAARARG